MRKDYKLEALTTEPDFFEGLMVTLLYTANMISSLTLRPHPKPLTCLDDFASRTDWKFSTWKEAPAFDIWRVIMRNALNYMHNGIIYALLDIAYNVCIVACR